MSEKNPFNESYKNPENIHNKTREVAGAAFGLFKDQKDLDDGLSEIYD